MYICKPICNLIVYIFADKNPLLTPVLSKKNCVKGHQVADSSEGLFLYVLKHKQCMSIAGFVIVHENLASIVVESMQKPVVLYCIASYHGGCKYDWRKVGEKKKFPSTPVIYVNEPGMYQCFAKTTNNCVLSDLMRVVVRPSTGQ